ncbi:hypothetical protein FHS89_001297 [Rubricella aquisinus]|uniref:DUF3429 domain-containing protein n=1 Tax=Rubricella aquisinus TaxID=2028108 RepID=A0A840X3N7_9RHOB|nr:DUF3429 domain-containing protein [Rubricella aquisinus]MBB5515287.1 hypothetical protein [Rubricella aquisinus]
MFASIPRPALILGAAGLLPFLWAVAMILLPQGTLPALWFLPNGPNGGQVVLVRYGTIILAFMGGCLWGFAAQPGRSPSMSELTMTVLPAIWIFFALSSGMDVSIWAIFAGFLALLLADVTFQRGGIAPVWWLALRIPLTTVVCICLLIGALA